MLLNYNKSSIFGAQFIGAFRFCEFIRFQTLLESNPPLSHTHTLNANSISNFLTHSHLILVPLSSTQVDEWDNYHGIIYAIFILPDKHIENTITNHEAQTPLANISYETHCYMDLFN